MADLREWAKGITFFLFATVMFYFLWDNIFLNVINFLGSDMFGIGAEAETSLSILKTVGWVSFVMLWLATVPIFAFYAIVAGSRNEVKTSPLELLKAIGCWVVMMPFLSFIYGLLHFLISTLNVAVADTSISDTASSFSWILGLILLCFLVAIPFYYILLGYGIKIAGESGKEGVEYE